MSGKEFTVILKGTAGMIPSVFEQMSEKDIK
jgi:hypothetical protein